MSERKSGWYWHVHHEVLVEWCYDYDERVAYIKAEKSAHEVGTRLRLMQPVRAIPERLAKALAEYDKARAERDKARAERAKAWAERDKARAERAKALAEYDKARAEYDKALAECMPELIALHAVECPDCPWDGHTIFPEAT